ncbi:hypothetical protein V8C37DRAFT_397080 [Trichoderma ceciliae]
MAPHQVTDDYYKVLGIIESAGKDDIRASYKRLAMIHHPDRNPNNPQATAQFQLIEAAYSTLFDPERRRIYDLHYCAIRSRGPTTTNGCKNYSQSQTNNKGFDGFQLYKQQVEKLDATLQDLRNRRDSLQSDLFKAMRERDRSQEAFNRLQEDAERNAQEDANMNSWFGFFFAGRLSAEEKQRRQLHMINNRAARTVREAELKRHRAHIATIQKCIDDGEAEITRNQIEKNTVQQREWRRQETVRLAEIQRQHELQRERERKAREDAERVQREQFAEWIRREQEAERVERERREQYAERIRREQDAERERREKDAERIRREQDAERERREHATEAVEEVLRKIREQMRMQEKNIRDAMRRGEGAETNGERMQSGKVIKQESTRHKQSAGTTGTTPCLHKEWWTKEAGSHKCEQCSVTTSRFAFRCPSCCIVACASCRIVMKGRR